MSKCKSIVIDGVEYTPGKKEYSGDVKIVILQRGWVMVGYFKRGDQVCSLTEASVLRQWGTSKGLGEIAENGPTSSTKLDPTNGLVEFHPLTIVATISCNQEKWSCHLK